MEWKHELDELINAGLGDVPQPNIPPNWRELMREVYGDPQKLIVELEAKETQRKADLDVDLAWNVMQQELERDPRGGQFGRRGPYGAREEPAKRKWAKRRTFSQCVEAKLAEYHKRRQVNGLLCDNQPNPKAFRQSAAAPETAE